MRIRVKIIDMLKFTPWPHQQRCIDKNMKYFNSENPVPEVTVAPTGAGKSFIIAGVVSQLRNPTIILQPSVELLRQNYKKFTDGAGGEASIYSASANEEVIGHTTFATLHSIKKDVDEFRKMGVENVLVDEAHFGYPPDPKKTFRKFLKSLRPKYVMAYTATALYLNSYGMFPNSYSQLDLMTRCRNSYFKRFNTIVQVEEIIKNDYWCDLDYQTEDFDDTDLRLNSTGAKFTDETIQKAVKVQNINNRIFLKICEIAPTRRGILVFLDSLESCGIMKSALERFGIRTEFISGSVKKGRKGKIDGFLSGEVKVMLNYGTLTTGFDYPELDTVILGRAVASLSLYYQMLGRGVRKGSESCQFIDFGGNIRRHGKISDLNYDYVENYGYGLFSGNRLLTGRPMTLAPLYKEQLRAGVESYGVRIWFGKHKGAQLSNLPYNYRQYLIGVLKTSTDPHKRMLRNDLIKLSNMG